MNVMLAMCVYRQSENFHTNWDAVMEILNVTFAQFHPYLLQLIQGERVLSLKPGTSVVKHTERYLCFWPEVNVSNGGNKGETTWYQTNTANGSGQRIKEGDRSDGEDEKGIDKDGSEDELESSK